MNHYYFFLNESLFKNVSRKKIPAPQGLLVSNISHSKNKEFKSHINYSKIVSFMNQDIKIIFKN